MALITLLGLFLQGNPGTTSRQHRMKSMSVYDLCECFFPLTGAEAKAIFKVFSQSVYLPLISFSLQLPSPCYCSFALWVHLHLFPLWPLPPTPRPGSFSCPPPSLLSFSAFALPPTLLLSQVLLTIVPSFSFHVFSFPL